MDTVREQRLFLWFPATVAIAATLFGFIQLRNLQARRVLLVGLLILCGLLLEPLADWNWRRTFKPYYSVTLGTDIISALEEREIDEISSDNTRICSLFARSFPFSGAIGQHWCIDAHGLPARPNRFASIEQVEELFRRVQITHVIAPIGGIDDRRQFDRWRLSNEGVASEVWSDARFEVYRLNLLHGAP